ncbi:hypothetical protein ACFZAG_38830 [Streptomyces sp. NPDC012403]|nr:hypothetical protein [Streptomyces sp. AC558_RSS880]
MTEPFKPPQVDFDDPIAAAESGRLADLLLRQVERAKQCRTASRP